MRRGDACQFADVDPAGLVSHLCEKPATWHAVPFLIHRFVLCEEHAALIEESGRLPTVGEWEGREWIGLPG
jgi:hypothetical protein